MALVDKPLRDLLTAFSSAEPTPGGGSASALASAVGASLLMMVAGLPKTRTGSEDDRSVLAAAVRALTGIRAQLTDAIDADAAAYDRVVAAYKLPKASGDEQQVRKAAIQQALRAATEAPLEVIRLATGALDHARAIAEHGHAAAASDVGVGIALLSAGLHGARLNVEINLSSVVDGTYGDDVSAEVGRLSSRASDAAVAAREWLRNG